MRGTFASGLCIVHGAYIATPFSFGCPHCPQPRTKPMPDLRTPAIRLADAYDRIENQRLRIIELEAEKTTAETLRSDLEDENKRLAALLADKENATPPQPWRAVTTRIAELVATVAEQRLQIAALEGKLQLAPKDTPPQTTRADQNQAARIAQLEIENEFLNQTLADYVNRNRPPQPSSAPQTAPGAQPVSDTPSPHTGLWRALKAGER